MKKILFLMFVLVMSVGGAWADFVPEEGKAYQIKSTEGDLYLNVRVDGTTLNNKVTSKDVVLGSKPQALYFAQKNGAYTIRTADGLYVGGHTNAWNMSATTEQLWQVKEVETGVYAFLCNGTSADYIGFDATTVGSAAYRNKSYSTNHGKFIIEECTEDNFIPSIYKTFSTSPAPVDGKWQNGTRFYTIKVQRAGYLASDRASSGYFTMSSSTKPTNDAGKWALVGTQKGIQLYNKATGVSKVLTFQSSENSVHCSMGTDLNAASSYFECVTAQNNSFLSGYECFKITGTEAYWNESNNSPYYLNVWTSDQALWGWGYSASEPSSGDAGSQFEFELVEELASNTYTFNLPEGVTVTYASQVYSNGQTVEVQGLISASEVQVNEAAPVGYNYVVTVDASAKTVTVTADPKPVLSKDDVNTSKAYYIYTTARGGLTVKNNTDTRIWGTSEDGVGQSVSTENENMRFAFVEKDGNLYLYNILNNKFVGNDGSLSEVVSAPILFKNPGTSDVMLYFDNTHVINLGGSNQIAINNWGGSTGSKDPGNSFIIKPVADLTQAQIDAINELLNPTNRVDVTYDYYIDDVKFASETINCKKGEAFPDPTKSFTGFTQSEKPSGMVEEEGTHNIILGAFSGPFELATLNEGEFEEGTKWYYMQNGTSSGNGYNGYVVYDATTKKSGFNTEEVNDPARKWTFVRKHGTPYFSLYNKEAGAVAMQEKLSSDSRYYPYHNQGVVMLEGDNEMLLELKNNDPGFSFKLANVEGTCLLGHHVQESSVWRLSIWGNEALLSDNGSRFVFTLAPEDVLYDWSAFGNKLDNVKEYSVGDGLGKYTCSATLDVDTWQATFDNQDEANYETHFEAMQAAIDGMSLNLPQPDTFFRMKGHSSGKYVYADAASEVNHTTGNISAGNCLPMGDLEDNGATSIFFFDGSHIISYQSPNYTGLYVYQSGLNKNLNDESGLDTFSFHEGVTKGTYRIHTDKANSNIYDYHADNGRTNRWSANDNVRTCFDIEEVTALPVLFKAVGHGYATLYSPVALSIPEGYENYVTIYTTNVEENNALKVAVVEDGIIPANTGVILYFGNEGEGYTLTENLVVEFPFAANAGSATSTLSGTCATVAADENSHVFALHESKPGFYKYSTTEGATLAGFKAYYETTTESSTRGFDLSFGGIVTSIEAMRGCNAQGVLFDLQGRRVSAAQKGLLIQNGNKVIR